MMVDGGVVRVVEVMKGFRTGAGWAFVDREAEARRAIGVGEKVIVDGMVNVLYGPKGCGKTTFFKALQFAVDVVDAGVDVVYVASEYEEVQKLVKLYVPRSLSEVLRDIASTVSGSIEIGFEGYNIISTPMGLFKAISIAISSIAKRFRRGRQVLVVVDEVRADSEERLSSFREWLEVFSNEVSYANLSYRDRVGGINSCCSTC